MKNIMNSSSARLVALALAMPFTSPAYAFLSATVTIDFELGDYYNSPGNLAQSGVFLPGTVGDIDYYLEDGVRHHSIPFDSALGSHIHGNTFTGNRRSLMSGDAGGAVFELDDGDSFSFVSWEHAMANDDLVVRGYQPGGGSFEVTLDLATYGSGGTTNPDFLALDSRFGNVNLVEYWFGSTGRGVLGLDIGQAIAVDNVVLAPAVPLPAAFPLFLSGMGLIGIYSRRRKGTA